MCEDLSEWLTEDFEDREEELRAQGDPKTLKLVEKRREKAEKRLKKTRDQTDKEKGNRYLNSFTYFMALAFLNIEPLGIIKLRRDCKHGNNETNANAKMVNEF